MYKVTVLGIESNLIWTMRTPYTRKLCIFFIIVNMYKESDTRNNQTVNAGKSIHNNTVGARRAMLMSYLKLKGTPPWMTQVSI